METFGSVGHYRIIGNRARTATDGCRWFWMLMLVALALTGCERPAGPEFLKLDNVRFERARLDGVLVVTADAVFHNPNRFGVDVTGLEVDVFIDEREAAEIRQTIEARMPASSEFSLPVTIEIPIDRVYDDLGDLLSDVLSRNKREIRLSLDGRILVRALKLELVVPFQHEEVYRLK